MNGRLYDHRLGRFPSPDPVVSRPWTAQGWNPYSYVQNSPLSFTDPTGYYMRSCLVYPSGGGFPAWLAGGFTAVSAALRLRHLSFEVPLYFTVRWGNAASISVGAGVSLWDDDSDAGLFGGWEVGHNRPYVTVGFGPVTPVWTAFRRMVSLASEQSPADERPKRIQVIAEIHDVLHHYRIRGILCRRSDPGCNDDWASTVFNHVDSNDIPFTDDDGRVGLHLIGPLDSPIRHIQNEDDLWTRNTTVDGHPFHPGTVTFLVHWEDDWLVFDVVGEGAGNEPTLNNVAGIVLFWPTVAGTVWKFNNPPNVRSIDILPDFDQWLGEDGHSP